MNSGERDWVWIVGTGALALVAVVLTLPSSPFCAFGQQREERVPMLEVPEAVRAVAAKELGPLDECTATRERAFRKVRWEIARQFEIGVASLLLSDAGEVLESERPVAIASLPRGVCDAVAAAFPKAAVVQATALESRGYEFTLAVDGARRHVRVGLDGAIEDVVEPAPNK